MRILGARLLKTSEECPALKGLETFFLLYFFVPFFTSEECPALKGLETR